MVREAAFIFSHVFFHSYVDLFCLKAIPGNEKPIRSKRKGKKGKIKNHEHIEGRKVCLLSLNSYFHQVSICYGYM